MSILKCSTLQCRKLILWCTDLDPGWIFCIFVSVQALPHLCTQILSIRCRASVAVWDSPKLFNQRHRDNDVIPMQAHLNMHHICFHHFIDQADSPNSGRWPRRGCSRIWTKNPGHRRRRHWTGTVWLTAIKRGQKNHLSLILNMVKVLRAADAALLIQQRTLQVSVLQSE